MMTEKYVFFFDGDLVFIPRSFGESWKIYSDRVKFVKDNYKNYPPSLVTMYSKIYVNKIHRGISYPQKIDKVLAAMQVSVAEYIGDENSNMGLFDPKVMIPEVRMNKVMIESKTHKNVRKIDKIERKKVVIATSRKASDKTITRERKGYTEEFDVERRNTLKSHIMSLDEGVVEVSVVKDDKEHVFDLDVPEDLMTVNNIVKSKDVQVSEYQHPSETEPLKIKANVIEPQTDEVLSTMEIKMCENEVECDKSSRLLASAESRTYEIEERKNKNATERASDNAIKELYVGLIEENIVMPDQIFVFSQGEDFPYLSMRLEDFKKLAEALDLESSDDLQKLKEDIEGAIRSDEEQKSALIEVLKSKFEDEELRASLLNTQNAILTYDDVSNTFWGSVWGTRKGTNMYGEALMTVRNLYTETVGAHEKDLIDQEGDQLVEIDACHDAVAYENKESLFDKDGKFTTLAKDIVKKAEERRTKALSELKNLDTPEGVSGAIRWYDKELFDGKIGDAAHYLLSNLVTKKSDIPEGKNMIIRIFMLEKDYTRPPFYLIEVKDNVFSFKIKKLPSKWLKHDKPQTIAGIEVTRPKLYRLIAIETFITEVATYACPILPFEDRKALGWSLFGHKHSAPTPQESKKEVEEESKKEVEEGTDTQDFKASKIRKLLQERSKSGKTVYIKALGDKWKVISSRSSKSALVINPSTGGSRQILYRTIKRII